MIQIIKKYKSAERDKTFPFSDWNRKDIFERLIKDFLNAMGYNPDQMEYDDIRGVVKLEIHKGLKVIVYVSSIQEKDRFLTNKISAPIDTIPDPETGKSEYEIAVVTNFEKWFFYFDGKEIYATTIERLEKDFEIVRALLSRDSIESGRFKEVARRLLYKEDNEPLRQELNTLRVKIANRILQEKTNIQYLKNPDGSYNNELLNEITTRWITRFLALKLAEDSGITFNFTLRDIRRSFELHGEKAKPIKGAKVKEETLSNAIRALMNEFERRYNGGIFMYEEGVDYITIPDIAFFDLLDFTTGWAFTIEDARIIGFVYERFLGQEIVIEEKKGKLQAVLKNIGEARGRRKAGGIYYTPKYIVDYIVENTLGEILNEKKKEIESGVKNLDCDKFLNALKEVKSLKVLDPACGSGSFLIKVLAEFKNFYEEIKNKAKELKGKINSLKRERTKGQMLFTDDKELNELLNKFKEIEKELEELKFPGTYALRHNIYGVDLDPKAIDISAFTLMIQVYDELKDRARCPTMIGENLKIGNSLVSSITPEEKEGFISRKELEKFKEKISELIKLREIEKSVDILSDEELKELIEENFNEVVDIYIHIKEKYPNAIPTPAQKLLDEWHKRARKEPIEKTFDVLIYQTGLARIFLKEVFFERIEKIKERIEFEINKPLVRYFNSKKKVLKDKELEEILKDEERLKEEYKFIKERATEISKSQPPKVFNWEIEFPEVFFDEDGTLKENPGFDCVVGNPPYVKNELLEEIININLKDKFVTSKGFFNTYNLFLELGINLSKKLGFTAMIVQNSFITAVNYREFRRYLSEQTIVKKIIDLGLGVFENVGVSSAIIVLNRGTPSPESETLYKTCLGVEKEKCLSNFPFSKERQKNILQEEYFDIYTTDFERQLIQKIENRAQLLDSFLSLLSKRGIEKITKLEIAYKEPEYSFKKLIRGKEDIERYLIRNYVFMKYNPHEKNTTYKGEKCFVLPKIIVAENTPVPVGVFDNEGYFVSRNLFCILFNQDQSAEIEYKFVLAIINSRLLEWYSAKKFKGGQAHFQMRFGCYKSLPIVRASKDQQAPIISLVSAIIKKKKEYHAISQNIEDYIDFGRVNLIRLDEFLKDVVDNFEVLPSLKFKKDNFDALRIKIEGNEAIIEYGIKRKIEEYEEIDEDEQVEVRGKYIIEWQEAGRGKVKDREAVELLAEFLKRIKNFSKAKAKTMWQKIAEVKVPEFTDEIRNGFLNFKSSMEKAKKLNKEIIKIDRAIDRLVYDLYGLTEDEIKVVEKSVWGDKFEEMYRKLPSKEDALKLVEEVKNDEES